MRQQRGLQLSVCDGGWASRGVLEVRVAHWGNGLGKFVVVAIGATVSGCGSIARFGRRWSTSVPS